MKHTDKDFNAFIEMHRFISDVLDSKFKTEEDVRKVLDEILQGFWKIGYETAANFYFENKKP